MKGHVVPNGYMGCICGEDFLFSTEEEYVEVYRELFEDDREEE